MGICWSEPPPPPPVTTYTTKPCGLCGAWVKGQDYCDPCLRQPSAPPMYIPPQPQPQYTYAVPYQQQQMYNYYQARPQQQQQMGTGTAMIGGFVLGALVSDMMDPTE